MNGDLAKIEEGMMGTVARLLIGSCKFLEGGIFYWNSVAVSHPGRRVLLKRGNGKRKTEDYSAETCRGNASWEFLKKLRNCLILVYLAEIFKIGGNH